MRSLVFHTSDPSVGPKDVKVIVNNRNLSFDDFESESTVTQSFVVTEDDLRDSKKINVRFVRFQSVTTLSVDEFHYYIRSQISYVCQVFVASNQSDAEETRIDAIDIYGIPVQCVSILNRPLTTLTYCTHFIGRLQT